MDFDVDASDLRRLNQRFAGASKIIQTEHTAAMRRATILVQGEAQKRVRKDTRTLARSLTTGTAPNAVRSLAGAVEGIVGSNQPHAKPVEFGRRAGATPPPIGSITRWAKKKGINPYALQRSIAKRGIPARPYLRPALEAKKAAIKAEFAAANRRIVAQLGGS